MRLLIAILILSAALAVADEELGILKEKRQCAYFYTGDLCTDCRMPDGWAVADECPDNFRVVKKNPVCTPHREDYCCTFGHSGSAGDCDDTVYNELRKECAFVENLSECRTLPIGWKPAPTSMGGGRLCPSVEYAWIEATLDCERLARDEEPTLVAQKKKHRKKENPYWIVASVILLLVSIIWVFYVMRWKDYSSL